MSQVITFEDYLPSPRYDSLPWTTITIEEGPTDIGPWTVIDTQPLDPVDTDPANPIVRNFTTDLASDLPDLWYRVVFFDASLDESQPTVPVQNTTPTTGAPYTSVAELQRILKIREPSTAQRAALERVIIAAAREIDAELDRDPLVGPPLSGSDLALCAQVNLDRAADLWRHTESAPGVLGVMDEMVAMQPGRYSWNRYAERLSPLKSRFGFA